MGERRTVAALIAATEARFHLEEGSLRSADRSQPLVSFKQLAQLLAYEFGFSPTNIAREFEVDPATVRSNVARARLMVKGEYQWWLYAKADLVDAWDDRPT